MWGRERYGSSPSMREIRTSTTQISQSIERYIMNRNDETKLLTEAEKKARLRTAARTARHRRLDIDAFKCMKHIIEETNRYNISAVAAALHSYIRMTIEKI